MYSYDINCTVVGYNKNKKKDARFMYWNKIKFTYYLIQVYGLKGQDKAL